LNWSNHEETKQSRTRSGFKKQPKSGNRIDIMVFVDTIFCGLLQFGTVKLAWVQNLFSGAQQHDDHPAHFAQSIVTLCFRRSKMSTALPVMPQSELIY